MVDGYAERKDKNIIDKTVTAECKVSCMVVKGTTTEPE